MEDVPADVEIRGLDEVHVDDEASLTREAHCLTPPAFSSEATVSEMHSAMISAHRRAAAGPPLAQVPTRRSHVRRVN